ncbi:cell wall-binding repeat-containing protein [Desulfitobacterium sp. Sab5]|uniref:cell wall-binding repeat-containing protein n=1 Tax=Desulfitobacterium nosdiversum TaxID=3375356 RepID=UPI003CEEAC16
MSLKRKITSLFLLITTFTLLFPVLTFASSSPTITRLAGIDRYETAAQIAKAGWSQSDYAILTSGENYPDALSAAPLARKYNAPILLTASSSLPSITRQTLTDLHVKNVLIIGGTGVISTSAESELQSMGIGSTRIFGNDRYETAIRVAQQITTTPSALFVVTGEDYSDALSVASIAALKQIPIILVPNDSIPDSVKNYIASINAVSKTYVMGYSDIISDKVINQFPNTERILGSDKYARNIAVSQAFNSDYKADTICVATGEGFVDALTGTAYSASLAGPIILVNNDSPANTKDYYQQRLVNAGHVYVFGGTGRISDSVLQNLSTSNNTSTDPNNNKNPENPDSSTDKPHRTITLSHLAKSGSITATFKYQILNSSGTNITSTIPVSQLSAVASSIKSSVVLSPSDGTGTIIFNSPSDLDQPIILTLLDLTNGTLVSLNSTSPSGTSTYTYTLPQTPAPTPGVSSPNEHTDLKVSKITIDSTKIAFDLTNPDGTSKVGYATYDVYDQYGENILYSDLARNLTFKSKSGTIIIHAIGLLKMTLNSDIDPATLTEVTIEGSDLTSGVSTSATLTVIPRSMDIISQ